MTTDADLDRAIAETVIAAYEMFADHETDETTERHHRERANAMRAES
jgi:hypothetical protein